MSQKPDSKHPPRIEFKIHFQTGHHGRKYLKKGACSKNSPLPNEALPRLTRLLALAHRWDRLISEGIVANRAEIARMGGLSRARITQIMDLLYLAPNIQDEILLPQDGVKAELAVPERAVRKINKTPGWANQRKLWRNLLDE